MSSRTSRSSRASWLHILNLNGHKRVSGLETEDHSVEVQLGLEASHNRLRPPEAVLFTLEGQIRHRQPFLAGGGGHHLRLIRWHDAIFEPLKQDDGTVETIDTVNRRACSICFALRRIRADEP